MLIPVETGLTYNKIDVRVHREYKAEFTRDYKFTIDEISIFDQYPKICKFLFSDEKVSNIHNEYYSRFGSYNYIWKNALEQMSGMEIQKLMYSESYIIPAINRMLNTTNEVFLNGLESAAFGDKGQREMNGDDIQFIHNNNLHFFMKGNRASKINFNTDRIIKNITTTTDWDRENKKSNIIINVSTSKFVLEYVKPSLIHNRKEVEAILKNKLDSVIGEFITRFLYKCFSHIQSKSDLIKNSVYMSDTVSNFGSISPEQAFNVSNFPELNDMFASYINEGIDNVIQAMIKKSEMLFLEDSSLHGISRTASPKFKDTKELENFMNTFLRKKMREDMIQELNGFAAKTASQLIESIGNQYNPASTNSGYYSRRRDGEKYFELLLQDFEV